MRIVRIKEHVGKGMHDEGNEDAAYSVGALGTRRTTHKGGRPQRVAAIAWERSAASASNAAIVSEK